MYDQINNLVKERRFSDAVLMLRQLLRLQPQNKIAYDRLAGCYESLGEIDRAEQVYRFIIQTWPNDSASVVAASNLGNLLMRVGRISEAEWIHTATLQAHPEDAYTMKALGLVYTETCRIEEAVAMFLKAAQVTKTPFSWSTYLGYSLHTGTDVQRHSEWIQNYGRKPFRNDSKVVWDQKSPLRVGWVGNVFREHSCSLVLSPILEHTKTHSIVYSDTIGADATTSKLKSMAKSWRQVAGMSHNDLAAIMRSDHLNVIVDLMGHKENGRLITLAQNPAPTKLGYIGYAAETGITDNIDQKVGWAYQPTESPRIGPLPAQQNGFITFGSVHRVAKLTKQVLSTWGSVLTAIPSARLRVIVIGGEKNVTARLQMEMAGIPKERLVLVDRVKDRMKYLEQAGQIDIHLDTWPYNGGATTFDMLWMGVPSLTMRGDQFQMGHRIMEKLPEFIAEDPEDYVTKAQKLSADLFALSFIRERARSYFPDHASVAARFDQVVFDLAAKYAPGERCCDKE